MTNENPLDRSQEVEIGVSEKGVRFKSNWRVLNALGNMFARKVDPDALAKELADQEAMARSAQIVKAYDAAGDQVVAAIKSGGPEGRRLAAALLEGGSRDRNKAEVAFYALEDLRTSPAPDSSADDGPATLDMEFQSRFERYAEDASTEDLRQRWGKVLAAEARKPGTFSRKVMRAVDELDRVTAERFEELCRRRIYASIPVASAGVLSVNQLLPLVDAGLFAAKSPELTLLPQPGRVAEKEIIVYYLPCGVGVAVTRGTERHAKAEIGFDSTQGTALKVYVLTDVGKALAEILDYEEASAVVALHCGLKNVLPAEDVYWVTRVGDELLFDNAVTFDPPFE